jgi:hypothetical protein
MTQYEGIGVQTLEAFEEPLRRLQGYTELAARVRGEHAAVAILTRRQRRRKMEGVMELLALLLGLAALVGGWLVQRREGLA